MKKFLYSLLMLFVGITTIASAQQEEAATVTTWNGNDLEITIRVKQKMTFEHTATKSGTLYLYAEGERENGQYTDSWPIDIWGGLYANGSYDDNNPLQDAGAYENGIGAYGWINVEESNAVRFTITAPDSVGNTQPQKAKFTLKSIFFPSPGAGQAPIGSRENPIELKTNVETALPSYKDTTETFNEDYATYCRFTATSDGVASISTEEYLIYYIEADKFDTHEFKSVVQDPKDNDHKFIVEEGVDYLVIFPNTRPTKATLLTIDTDGVGASAQFPKKLKKLPASIGLKRGDNYYAFSHDLIGKNKILEISTAEGWSGTITYMENSTDNSTELTKDKVTGNAATFVKNVDPRYLDGGNQVIMNFNMTSPNSIDDAATLTLRAPKAGECFDTAIEAALGTNTINGPAGTYWYSYTSPKDVVISFGERDSIKHVNFAADGIDFKVLENAYRLYPNETIYVCLITTQTNQTFTVNAKDVEAGDFCDTPIVFELGQKITIKDRGDNVTNYREFTAEKAGFALITIKSSVVLNNYWSIHFRKGCNTKVLDYETLDSLNKSGRVVARTLKLPVGEGCTYSMEIMSFANNGRDITFYTSFASAKEGEICETAVELESIADTIRLPYELNVAKWYKVIVEKAGYYTISAKLGYNSNLMARSGSVDAPTVNLSSDSSKPDPYMAGYKTGRIYVGEGQPLYIYTKTGEENDIELYGDSLYFVVSYHSEARPGEEPAIALEAKSDTTYTIMTNENNGYTQWYIYTIPGSRKATITLSSTEKYERNNINIYKEDGITPITQWDGVLTLSDLTNQAGDIIGKRMEIRAARAERTIYIKVSTIDTRFYSGAEWKIETTESPIEEEEEDENANVDAPQIEVEKFIIYDLMGRRVENPTKGIYIINGVKRIIK